MTTGKKMVYSKDYDKHFNSKWDNVHVNEVKTTPAVGFVMMASGCWNIPSLFQMLKLSGMSTPMGQGMQ